MLEPVSVVAEVLQEESDVISEQEPDYSINEPEIVEMPYEPVNKSNEDVDEAYEDLQDVSMSDMTKERYEALTDEEGTEGDRKGTRYEDGRKVNKLANKIIGKTAFLRLP